MSKIEVLEEKKIVKLGEDFTHVNIPEETKDLAMNAAFWLTASEHEWVWTKDQQIAMAKYCLWASQQLACIKEIANNGISR